MPPKKGIAVKRKAPAKGDTAKMPPASMDAPKRGPGRPPKESINDDLDEEEPAKKSRGRPKKATSKKDTIDEDAMEVDSVDSALGFATKKAGRPLKKNAKAAFPKASDSEEDIVEPPTTKRGPGRPPKKAAMAALPGSDVEENMKTPTKKPGRGRPPKKAQSSGPSGGWIYVKDKGTAFESSVVHAGFPWVSTLTLGKDDPIEYRTHTHRIAFLILSGKATFFQKTESDIADRALSGIHNKQNEIFDIAKHTTYRTQLLSKICKVVEGHEVLDQATRDRWIISGDIKWDNDVNSDVVGKVVKKVIDEGDVTANILAEHQAQEDERARLAAEDEAEDEDGDEAPVMPSFKHGWDGNGEDYSSLYDAESQKAKEEHPETDYDGPNSDIPKNKVDSGDDGEEHQTKKTLKKNGKGPNGKGNGKVPNK